VTTQALRRRSGRALTAVLLAAAVTAGTVAVTEAPAEADTARRDASTGWMPDVSPSQVSAVVDWVTGATTVFGRGTDGAIWYRTADVSGSWTGWTAIPGMVATSGPSAVLRAWNGGVVVDVVVRGPDNGAYWWGAELDPLTGRPDLAHAGWGLLRGGFTSALTVASLGGDSLVVVGRGGDGAIWQRTLDLNWGWSDWFSLGGAAFSVPAVEAVTDGSTWWFEVSVVGTDWRVWQRATNADPQQPHALGAWGGGLLYSSHGLGAMNTTADWWGADRTLTTGGADHSVVLVDPQSSWYAALGGWLTSTAAIVSLPDGTQRVFARGGDNQLWFTDFDPATETHTPWTNLGGQLL
jgi:hypothetical protein